MTTNHTEHRITCNSHSPVENGKVWNPIWFVHSRRKQKKQWQRVKQSSSSSSSSATTMNKYAMNTKRYYFYAIVDFVAGVFSLVLSLLPLPPTNKRNRKISTPFNSTNVLHSSYWFHMTIGFAFFSIFFLLSRFRDNFFLSCFTRFLSKHWMSAAMGRAQHICFKKQTRKEKKNENMFGPKWISVDFEQSTELN